MKVFGFLTGSCETTVRSDGSFSGASEYWRKSAAEDYMRNVKPSSHIKNYNLHTIFVVTVRKAYPETRAVGREGVERRDCGFVVQTWGGSSLSLAPFLVLLLVLLTICELSCIVDRCTGKRRPKRSKL